MVNRAKFDEKIEKLNLVAERYVDCGFSNSILKMDEIKKNFDLKVMVVGQFNAGKSALINALLGRDNFLREQQRPETAIATELCYSENETYYAVTNQGLRNEIDNSYVVNPHEYHHLELLIDSESLKKLEDFTVVDTPGFDSGIEAHNKALASYLQYGVAYVLVIDAENGGIDKESLRFLDEISQYSNRVAVILNKCDKQTNENIIRIKSSAEQTLQMYGYDYPVYCTSKYEDNISQILVDIILKFDAQALFDSQMENKLCLETENMASILNIIKGKTSCNTYEFDVEINKYKKAIEQLKENFSVKRKEAENTASNCTQEIIAKIKSALQSKVEAVAKAALCGGSAGMEAIIVETIRPVIISELKRFSTTELEKITRSIDFSNILDMSTNKDISNIITNLAIDTKNLIDSGVFGKVIDKLDEEKLKKKHKSDIYHAISGIAAIATDFIAPVLEIIIFVLPDVVQLLGALFGESDKERIERQFSDSIIPQITSRMYDMLEKAVVESYEALINSMEVSIEEKLNSIHSLLARVQESRDNVIEEFELFTNKISEDIIMLREMASRRN